MLATAATRRVQLTAAGVGWGVLALLGWALFAALAPRLLGIDHAGLESIFKAGDHTALNTAQPGRAYSAYPLDKIVPIGAVAGLLALGAFGLMRNQPRRPRRARGAPGRRPAPSPRSAARTIVQRSLRGSRAAPAGSRYLNVCGWTLSVFACCSAPDSPSRRSAGRRRRRPPAASGVPVAANCAPVAAASDGTMVWYARNSSGLWDAYIGNANCQGEPLLPPYAGNRGPAAMTPDGRYVLLTTAVGWDKVLPGLLPRAGLTERDPAV